MEETAYQTLKTLVDAGAHLVLHGKEDKKAFQTGWQKKGRSVEEAVAHLDKGGLLGHIPGRLGLLVVDVDFKTHGEPTEVVTDALGEPLLSIRSKTPGNFHLYYKHPGGRKRRVYQWLGGEVLADTRSAILYGDAADLLAASLPRIDETTPPMLELLPKKPPRRGSKSERRAKQGARRVREATEGDRNNTLFAEFCSLLRQGHDPDGLIRSAIANGLGKEEVEDALASAKKTVSEQRPDWYVVGEHYAGRHWQGRARHVSGDGAPRWWLYEKDHWRQLTEKDYAIQHHMDRFRFGVAQELVDEGKRPAAELLGDAKEWKAQQTSYPGEFWAGMAYTLRGEEPAPSFKHFAAANGVVSLRDGKLVDHAPEHETRSVASGRYLPDQAQNLRRELDARFREILPEDGVDWFLDLVGLAMTGRTQSWRSILWLWGKSGSGKGGIARLLLESFGDKSRVVAKEFFEKTQGDIDVALTDVIERQPLIIMVDEFSTTQMDLGRLLSRTGDTPQASRRPYGYTIKGLIYALFVVLTVEAPSIPVRTGFERRLAVLATQEEIPDNRKYDGIPQVLRDAVITLGAQRAGEALKLMDKKNYHAPEGDMANKVRLMQEADPCGMWLETLADDYDKTSLADLVTLANKEHPHLDKEITVQLMSRRVRNSRKWRRGEVDEDGKTLKCIRLKEVYCTEKLFDGALCGQPISGGRCPVADTHADQGQHGGHQPPAAPAADGDLSGQGGFEGMAPPSVSHFVHELDRRNVRLETQIAEGRRRSRLWGFNDRIWDSPEYLDMLLRTEGEGLKGLKKKESGRLDDLKALSLKSRLAYGMGALREAVRENPQSVPTDVELAAFGGATFLFEKLATLALTLHTEAIRDVEFWRGVLVDLRQKAVKEIEAARDRAGWQEWLTARISGGCSPSEGG